MSELTRKQVVFKGLLSLLFILTIVELRGQQHTPSCSYGGVSTVARPLLQHIDQVLPRAMITLMQQLKKASSENYMPRVATDSCFVEFRLANAFPLAHGQIKAQLSRQLLHGYYKSIGNYNSIQVLEYATPQAAAAAKLVQDSLVVNCQGRNPKLEPCAGIDSYRVTQYQSCLLRYDLYSQDPLKMNGLRQLRSSISHLL